uniref:uncharacterized protein LOC124055944 n=1 Tax=Scatophagus argus TaxID=75038 RepID=UPI001ED83F2D|nr:uncharacterized protein LOC124055944 [Scatophagus argus]
MHTVYKDGRSLRDVTHWFAIGQNEAMWYIIPNLICKNVGSIEFLLKCDFDLNRIPVQLCNFHRQVFLAWMLTYKHHFSPHKYLIWNNRYIKNKNKSIYYDGWLRHGILTVRQLLDKDGNLMTYTEFLRKYGLPVTPKEVVFDAIPAGILRLGQGCDSDRGIKISAPMLGHLTLTDKKCNNFYIRNHCQETSIPSIKSFREEKIQIQISNGRLRGLSIKNIVSPIRNEGYSMREIAISYNGVYYSLQRRAQTGSNQSRKRSGRPCCTTEQEDKYIRVSSLRNRRLTGPQLAASLNASVYIYIEEATPGCWSSGQSGKEKAISETG